MKRAIGIAACLLLFSTGSSWSGELGFLKGEKFVAVAVEPLNPELEGGGLTKQQLKTDAELRLRQMGIDVSKEYGPVLLINVTAVKGSGPVSNIYAFNINVLFQSSVLPASDVLSVLLLPNTRLGESVQVSAADINTLTHSKIFNATLWHRSFTGFAGAQRLSSIRDAVKDEVEEFLNDWLSVNPR